MDLMSKREKMFICRKIQGRKRKPNEVRKAPGLSEKGLEAKELSGQSLAPGTLGVRGLECSHILLSSGALT